MSYARPSTGRVLVVDDNRTNRLMLSANLKGQGHSVGLAENGKHALEMLVREPFDLVLLDILMPEMDGYEVLERMKKMTALRDIPVLVISSVDELDSVVRCIELGADDYLPKHYDPVVLKARIGACLEKRRLRQETDALLSRLEREIQEARRLQLSMVPREFPSPTAECPVSVDAYIEPAREIGGDLYDFFNIGPDTFCFLVGDVSGKGAAAGMFMARTRTLLRTVLKQGYNHTGTVAAPSRALAEVNAELSENNPEVMFVTVVLGFLNVQTGQLTISNAAHDDPYILRGDGRCQLLSGARGRPLGVNPDSEYEMETFELGRDESIFVYTDGVTDAVNRKEEFYSAERLESLVGSLRTCAPAEIIQAVRQSLKVFAGDTPQFDDITMLAVQWLAPAPS